MALEADHRDRQDGFPDLFSASRRLRLGVPRQVRISRNGQHALYLRSESGFEPLTSLWHLDLARVGAEPTRLADPAALSEHAGTLSDEELVMQRRTRSVATGVTAYSATDDFATVVFTVSGDVFVTSPAAPSPRALDVHGASDVTLDPTGRTFGYVHDGSLFVSDLEGHSTLLAAAEEEVVWGLPDLVSAEEIGRTRGFWWLPDGKRVLASRVDTTGVGRWQFGDLSEPATPPTSVRYPQAGDANAAVSLFLLDLEGNRTPVGWDAAAYPYLVSVRTMPAGPTVLVQSRDQRSFSAFGVEEDGGTRELYAEHAEHWLDVVPGVPTELPDGRLVRVVEDGDDRRLSVDGVPVTPAGLQVRSVAGVDGDTLVLTAWTRPRETHVFRLAADGGLTRVTQDAGVHSAAVSPGGLVVTSEPLGELRPAVTAIPTGGRRSIRIPVATAIPPSRPVPAFWEVGPGRLSAALLLPQTARESGAGDPLPVLLDPYGGPGAQRVTASLTGYAASQWFADQGFAVVVIDGRGTPGRGIAWDHAVDGDVAGLAVADQVEGLHALAEQEPRLDLTRVGVRGWSFGGFLALNLALRHPDLIRAAVAGAPVVDWELYDTHYTERYLGRPQDDPAAYERSRVPRELPECEVDQRPALMLIHGLMDDNVHPANTLRIAARLRQAGWAHEALLLPQAHHSVTDPAEAAALLRTELDFLRRHLCPGRSSAGRS